MLIFSLEKIQKFSTEQIFFKLYHKVAVSNCKVMHYIILYYVYIINDNIWGIIIYNINYIIYNIIYDNLSYIIFKNSKYFNF
jgi:hypothetical protein